MIKLTDIDLNQSYFKYNGDMDKDIDPYYSFTLTCNIRNGIKNSNVL